MWYRLASFVRVRRLGARVLIQPRAGRTFLQEDAIARISGAGFRIGNAGTLANITPRLRALGNRFYDRLIRVDETGTVHETVRNDQFVFGLTGRHSKPFEFPTTAAAPRDPSVVIALGAGHVSRVWPVEKLARLLQHLRSRYPTLRIVLLGTEADLSMGGRLQQLSGGGLDDRVGKTSLQEYVELIAAASLVICNETSAYHIAMSFRRKVVCLLGGGHYGLFAPYPAGRGSVRAIALSVPMDCFGCNWKCKYAPEPGGAYRCVASISVDAAMRAVDEMLDR
jgi:ADP-heptose:LPS heptosyltransferase